MIKAYAKVNLKLKIKGKLANGYHELDMINAKISLYDSIYIKKDKENKITYSNFQIHKEEDTIYKMIVALQNKFSTLPNLNIYIKKRIPVGFGLGGMSSDASSILNYLDKKFKLNMSLEDKIEFIKQFGTDMIYCLYDTPAIVQGIGDKVIPINLDKYHKILLVNPNLYISTKEMYQEILNFNLNNSDLENDFEYIARYKYPYIDEIIKKIEGICSSKVQMSGSGSAIIVLNPKTRDCKKIKREFRNLQIKRYNIKKGRKYGKF